MKLHFDFETFSEVDLLKHGAARYARHSSTQVLMVAWCLVDPDNPAPDPQVSQWDCTEPDDKLDLFLRIVADPAVTLVAWNAAFEWNILRHVLGVDVAFDRFYDPMILARSLSLPSALAAVSPVLNIPKEMGKDSSGKALISFFCSPRRSTQKDTRSRNMPGDNANCDERWVQMLDYNRKDVLAEMNAMRRMMSFDMGPFEWRVWFVDRAINEAGVPVNLRAIENAKKLTSEITRSKLEKLNLLTALDNANSTAQLLPWLKSRGYPFNDLKAGHIKRALDAHLNALEPESPYQAALELRAEVSRASVKKFDAYSDFANEDGVVRNMHSFGGASRTLRWSGSGVQLQNMMRPVSGFESAESQHKLAAQIERYDRSIFEFMHDKPLAALGSGCRAMIQAPSGFKLVGADYNAIENRVVGWITGETKILSVFERGLDPYIDFATYMFKQTYEEIADRVKSGDKKMRATAKPAVLGCAYGLSGGEELEDGDTGEIVATGLLGYARGMGVNMTQEEAHQSVRVWRETYLVVVRFWRELHDAFSNCIKEQRTTRAGMLVVRHEAPFVTVELPSGRRLFYLRPRIEQAMTPWGQTRPTITYEGYGDRKKSHVWGRVKTHPGKLVENVVQAVARDLLATALVRAHDAGLDVRLHVHDEIVALARAEDASLTASALSHAMASPIDWAQGLPLKADAEISQIFVKT